nr:copper chaperone [Chitinophagaceae bacterium]
MKKITSGIILSMLLSIIQTGAYAQKSLKTDTLTVLGNCGMCKERIEEAAYVKGVKSATWNKSSKILTVVYNNDKTDVDKVAKSIAAAGHDSHRHKAADIAYKKIPACCAYRTGTCDHD